MCVRLYACVCILLCTHYCMYTWCVYVHLLLLISLSPFQLARKRGLEVREKDIMGATALHMCALCGHPELTSLLCKLGADRACYTHAFAHQDMQTRARMNRRTHEHAHMSTRTYMHIQTHCMLRVLSEATLSLLDCCAQAWSYSSVT